MCRGMVTRALTAFLSTSLGSVIRADSNRVRVSLFVNLKTNKKEQQADRPKFRRRGFSGVQRYRREDHSKGSQIYFGQE